MTVEKLDEYDRAYRNMQSCKSRVSKLNATVIDVDNPLSVLSVSHCDFTGHSANTILNLAKSLAESELEKAENIFKDL